LQEHITVIEESSSGQCSVNINLVTMSKKAWSSVYCGILIEMAMPVLMLTDWPAIVLLGSAGARAFTSRICPANSFKAMKANYFYD